MTFYTKNTMTSKISNNDFLTITPSQASQLEAQGCFCPDWSKVRISPASDLRLIRNCRFIGEVVIGEISADNNEGIFNACIKDCAIGHHPYISGVTGRLDGLTIGNNVCIENVGRIEAEAGATFGVGTEASVLDETGSRPAIIFPGLTAQLAALMAHLPKWTDEVLRPMLDEELSRSPRLTIEDDAVIRDCKHLKNVHVGRGVTVSGASRLIDGSIINNARHGAGLAFVGADVDAEHFIIEDGRVDSGALLRNCYVGQGAVLDKRFTAHDSLFFANCACECGEACAILAGPYTVTMHKSSLLIGGQYSFFNAGSGTNSSNHKYKLGPVHWGLMHRGVKTSSDAYIMWGGAIGAFSLLMGCHKQHPDTSAFPFSYIFGTPDAHTIVAPALMLKSCGLMRDELKWPKRDARVKARLPLADNITFDVFNPVTVQSMLEAIPLLKKIGETSVNEAGFHKYRGLQISHKSVDRARRMYTLAIAYYINSRRQKPASEDVEINVTSQSPEQYRWYDLAGQILPVDVIERIKNCNDLATIKTLLNDAFAQYRTMERKWIDTILTPELRESLGEIDKSASELEAMIEKDRRDYLESLATYNQNASI